MSPQYIVQIGEHEFIWHKFGKGLGVETIKQQKERIYNSLDQVSKVPKDKFWTVYSLFKDGEEARDDIDVYRYDKWWGNSKEMMLVLEIKTKDGEQWYHDHKRVDPIVDFNLQHE